MDRNSSSPPEPLSGPITMGQFRARLAEMADRVLSGEEITVLRGSEPIGRFVPCEQPPRRRPDVMREMLGEQATRELLAALSEPLSERDQRILEGEGTDEAGVWTGLPDEPFGEADRGG